MNHKILLLFALALFTTCTNNTANTTSDNSSQKDDKQMILFDRLVGLWKNEDGKTYERWTKNTDGSFLSVGFQIKGSDTIFTERVFVHHENSQWISENTVPEQNKGKAIKFMVTQLTQEEVHFNNPAHDFPTDIHYHLADENTIKAFIAGPNSSGGIDTIPYNFMRVIN